MENIKNIENTKENALRYLEDAILPGEDRVGCYYDASKILEARQHFSQYGIESKLTEAIDETLGIISLQTKIQDKKEFIDRNKNRECKYWRETITESKSQIERYQEVLKKDPNYFPVGLGSRCNIYLKGDVKNIDEVFVEYVLANVSGLEASEYVHNGVACKEEYINLDNLNQSEKSELKQKMIKDLNFPKKQRKIFGDYHGAAGITKHGKIKNMSFYNLNFFDGDGENYESGAEVIIGERVGPVKGVEPFFPVSRDIDSACKMVEFFKERGLEAKYVFEPNNRRIYTELR